MGETRCCRKCGEPIPESRGPRAEDCGLPKCKSKAYRLQKKAEAEAMAAALATAARAEKESSTADTDAIPNLNRDPEQSSERSSASCDSARSASSVQEVRLRPGQQSIVLVCGCGARTEIQISHISADSTSLTIPEPVAESEGAISVPAADSVSTEADELTKEVAIPDSKSVASPSLDSVAQREAEPLGQSATASVPSAPTSLVASPVADAGASVANPSPIVPSSTSAAAIQLDDLPDPIPFTVYEMYAYRGTSYDEPILIEEAVTRLGNLHPSCQVTFTSNPEKGFKLCAPTGFHRILWGIAYKLNRCQLPGKLIVYGQRGPSGGQIMSHNVSVSMIEKLVGRNWKWRVGG